MMKQMISDLRKIFVLLVTAFVSVSIHAADFWFKHLGVSQNLVGSQVNSICKDTNGFIWIGTSTGLSRYDGITVRNFTSEFSNPTALPDSYIESVQEDASGMLWLRANGHYVMMDPSTETFDRSVSQRLSMVANNIEPELIFVDSKKNLWVYDKNVALYYYKVSQDLIYTFDQKGDNPVLPEGQITGLTDTPEGVLVAYSSGLVVSLTAETQSVAWSNNVVSSNISASDNYHIFYDNCKNIWLFGDRNSFFYDSETKTWYRSLSEFCQTMQADFTLGNDLVTGVDQDKKGRVWITTDRGGMIVFQPKERLLLAHVKMTGQERGLPSNYLNTVYVDDMDAVWVGTQRHGASYWAPNLYLFTTTPYGDVNNISIDRNKNIWMATHNRGLICRRADGSDVLNYGVADGLCDNMFSCVLAASDGSIWAGSNRFGLSRMKNGSTTHYSTTNGLNDNCVQALAEDIHGNLWIGTKRGGLQCLNAKTGAFSNFSVSNAKLPSDNVTSIYTSKNMLVAGTANGVFTFNLNTNQSVIYSGTSKGEHHFTNNSITAVYLDSRGLLWVGTSEGLNLLNLQLDQLTVFSTEQYGLPSNTIYGISEDSKHNIWVITNNGACRILVQTDVNNSQRYQYALFNYDERDGLQGIDFNEGALCTTPDGEIYMGSQLGLSQLSSHSERKTDYRIRIMLSALKVNGQLVEVGKPLNGHVVLHQTLNSSSHITLRHDENTIRILLGVNDYGHSERARYTYLLDGSGNESWQSVLSDGSTIELKNLRPGKYLLHIRGSLDNGNTAADERLLEIIVQSVWYLSWWFYACLIVFIAISIFLLRKFLKPVKEMYRQRKESINLYQEKKDQLESLANEIRSDVVSMIPQFGLMQLDAKTAEDKEKLQAMQHKIRQFLTKINQLREDRSLVVNDAGLASDLEAEIVGEEDKQQSADEGMLLFDDNGIAQGNCVLSDDGQIEVVPTANCRVFLIEKDRDMLEFMADCIKGNYQLSLFTDAEEAWNAILDEQPDLIMCAHNLEGTSGSELCHRVKNMRSLERLPFIITTEEVMNSSEMAARKITMMADDYIPQPMNLKSAIIRINRLLGVSTPNDELLNDDTMQAADSMRLGVKLLLRQQVDDYVMQNISRKDLTIDELSRVLNVSRTMLFRKVETVTGRAPADYIRAVRLQEAAKLLEGGFLSISDIADELGFANSQNFSYYFKLEYGVLPTEYIELNKNANNDRGGNNTLR